MNYADYDFEGLWFDIYKKVINQNSHLNGNGLDKSQLREVATSIFIAKTTKGIVRPESQSNTIEIPDKLKPLENKSDFNSRANDSTLATSSQVKTIKKLLNHPQVNHKEKRRIRTILTEPEISKTTASDILSYFYGNREKQNGKWTKVSTGVLDNRQPHPVH